MASLAGRAHLGCGLAVVLRRLGEPLDLVEQVDGKLVGLVQLVPVHGGHRGLGLLGLAVLDECKALGLSGAAVHGHVEAAYGAQRRSTSTLGTSHMAAGALPSRMVPSWPNSLPERIAFSLSNFSGSTWGRLSTTAHQGGGGGRFRARTGFLDPSSQKSALLWYIQM